MPSRTPLTKLSFRRDVRLFLTLLVGFLVVLIVALLLLLQRFAATAYDAVWANWRTAADVAVRELSPDDSAVVDAKLAMLRTRYGIAGVRVVRRDGREITSGVVDADDGLQQITKQLPDGTLILTFDAGELNGIRRTYWTTAAICLFATAAGVLLLLLYLPRITQPVESMLESAAEIGERKPGLDDQQYLIETFRTSIDRLRAQETELHRLHDLQKSRADDLERVTAALTRSLASGFLALDPEGRIVDANSAAREILHAAGELPGRTPADAFGESEFTTVLTEAHARQAAVTRAEVTYANTVVGLTTVPLTGEQQQFLGLLALFTDLTSLRQLEVRVRDLQNLADLGEISAGIAHEFRNSLAAILGYLRLARRTANPEATRGIERAEAEASTLSAAVDALLAFARPMRLEQREVELRDLVCDVAERVAAQLPEVAIDCGGGPAVVAGDAALLVRLFENLVRNAADSVRLAGRHRVTVTVTAAPEPTVRIDDEGVGLDPADVPRLLLPFQSDKPGGYGLGLPLARKIALLHGGDLKLSGEAGKGATVVVTFPAIGTVEAPADTFRNTLRAAADGQPRAVSG